MEEHEVKHIYRNLRELVDITSCNIYVILTLLEKEVLGCDDDAILESIHNQREKTLKFYRIIVTKSNSYKHLIAALESGRQSAAVQLLQRLEEDSCPSITVPLNSRRPGTSSGNSHSNEVFQENVTETHGDGHRSPTLPVSFPVLLPEPSTQIAKGIAAVDKNAVINMHPEVRVLSEPAKSFLEEVPLLPKVTINSSESGIKLTLRENENSMCDNNLVNLFAQLFEKSPVDPDKLEVLKRHCVLMNSLYIALSKST